MLLGLRCTFAVHLGLDHVDQHAGVEDADHNVISFVPLVKRRVLLDNLHGNEGVSVTLGGGRVLCRAGGCRALPRWRRGADMGAAVGPGVPS